MSFGFGVGDFITVAEYIDKVISCLKDGRSEYQDLMNSFYGLQLIFTTFSKFPFNEEQMHTYPQLQTILRNCKQMLDEFVVAIEIKYNSSLGLNNSAGIAKDVIKKFEFGFRRKEGAERLLLLLQVQVGQINTLLNIQGL
jgi:hypothetical protein